MTSSPCRCFLCHFFTLTAEWKQWAGSYRLVLANDDRSLNSVTDDVYAEKFLKNTVRDSFSHVGPLEKFASTAPGISRGLLDLVTINHCGLSWDYVYHSTCSSQNKNITSMNSQSSVLNCSACFWHCGLWHLLWLRGLSLRPTECV